MKRDVLTLDGDKAGDIELADAIYDQEPRADLLHRVVLWQLAKLRQGTRKTLGRSEVTGSTRKIVRQKGSGGARHGNKKAPLFRGGGKAHGPVVRDHAHSLPKKVRRLGLIHALSAKAKDNALIIVESAQLPEPKTKALKEKFGKLNLRSALVIDGPEVDDNFALALRNIPYMDVLPAQGANVRDIIGHDTLILTRAGAEALEARLK